MRIIKRNFVLIFIIFVVLVFAFCELLYDLEWSNRIAQGTIFICVYFIVVTVVVLKTNDTK